MKTDNKNWVWLLLILITSCSLANNMVSGNMTLQQKIESKNFTVYVTRCMPTDLVNTTFNSDVVLKIKNDSAYANLPFHGLLNVNPMEMTTGPISFDLPMKGFTMNHQPDKGWNIVFNVYSDPNIYQVSMNITTKGVAVVKVTSTKRTTMTYFGNVD